MLQKLQPKKTNSTDRTSGALLATLNNNSGFYQENMQRDYKDASLHNSDLH